MITINGHDLDDISIDGVGVVKIQDALSLEVMWEKVTPPTPTGGYFYIENKYNGTNTITITKTTSGTTPASGNYATSVEYSKDDGETWTSLSLANSSSTISMTRNAKVLFRNDSGAWSYYSTDDIDYGGVYFNFKCNRANNVGGNVMSLVDYTGTVTNLKNGVFCRLFENNSLLIDSSSLQLPSTTSENCYYYMFSGCNNMTTSPSLPATTMSSLCYCMMFDNCRALTTAPSLTATTLASDCYSNMFNNCTALTTPPSLPATTLASYCYIGMFSGCTGLTSTPTLSSTNMEVGCYQGMFSGCTGLTSTPSLPATTLASDCYRAMFQGCTSLTTINTISATTAGENSCTGMFSGCTALTTAPSLNITTFTGEMSLESMFSDCTHLTTAPSLPATTLEHGCYSYMFSGCTTLTTGPVLPATTLAQTCYANMFRGCTSLNNVTSYANDISATDCITNWLYGVANSGTFYNNGSATYPTGASGIPSGWTEV